MESVSLSLHSLSHDTGVNTPRASEGAPAPIPGHALSQALRQAVRLRPEHIAQSLRRAIHAGCRRRVGILQVGRALAVAPARSGDLPAFVFRVAEGTGPTAIALGVVIRILVERNDVGRVEVTEDVAAASAVMAAGKIGEGSGAGRFVADGCFVIRLPVVSARRIRHRTKPLRVDFTHYDLS